MAAQCSAEVVRNGTERGEANCWIGNAGEAITYTFQKDTPVHSIRLVFDSDLNRKYQNMPCSYPLIQPKVKVPACLIKAYRIEGISADGTVHTLEIAENHQRLVYHAVDWQVKEVRFVPLASHGSADMHLFAFELV